MRLHKYLSLDIHPADKRLECIAFHPPMPASTNLDRRQITRSHQCISLRSGNIQRFCNVS